jgi:hypothetical protein
MKEIGKMCLGVLRELKNVRIFFDRMERTVKGRDPEAVQRAYMFLVHLVREMDTGCLTPENITLDVELSQVLQGLDDGHIAKDV